MGANVRKVLLLFALILGVNGAWGACANLRTNCSGPANSCSELTCYDGSTLSCPWDFPYRGGGIKSHM